MQKKKDPNAPKLGSSSYKFFCQDMRDTVKSKKTEFTKDFIQLTMELGKEWRELGGAERKPVRDCCPGCDRLLSFVLGTTC